MRGPTSVLLLTCALGCNWPPYEGMGGDGISTCGAEWKSIGTAQSYKPLNAVHATQTDVYAVGDSGFVLRLRDGAKPEQTSISSSILDAVWVSSNDEIYIAASDGIYTKNALSGSMYTFQPTTSACSSVWGTNDIVFATCGKSILRKQGTSSFSEDKAVSMGNFSVVTGDSTRVFVSASDGFYYTKPIVGGAWEEFQSGQLTSRNTSGWVDKNRNIYIVGEEITYSTASFNNIPLTWVDKWTALQPFAQPRSDWHLSSIWISDNGKTYISGYSALDTNMGKLFSDVSGTWTAAPTNARLTSLYGNARNIYVAGKTAMQGFLWCRGTNSVSTEPPKVSAL